MRAPLKALGLTLGLLLISSMACTKVVQVPVAVPAPDCPMDPFPDFPRVGARACGEDVCMTPPEAVDVWAWARAARRWAELAQVCLDARS